MSKMEMYKKAFMETFEVSENQLNGLEYQSVPLWDSVGHMALIAVLEQSFDIMMETDDIIDLSSFEKGMEIFTPSSNGVITPNNKIGSNTTINLNVTGAIDPEGTARSIITALNNSYYRGTNGANALVFA